MIKFGNFFYSLRVQFFCCVCVKYLFRGLQCDQYMEILRRMENLILRTNGVKFMSIRILTTTLTLIFFVAACSTDEPVSTAGLITPEVQDSVISIETLSTKPWIVSGGDVLVEVRVSEPSSANALRVELNGTDVTQRFIDVSTHRKQALLRGLPEGDSNLTAS